MTRLAELAMEASHSWFKDENRSLLLDVANFAELVRLHLAVEGAGTVWVKNIELLLTPA